MSWLIKYIKEQIKWRESSIKEYQKDIDNFKKVLEELETKSEKK